MIDKNTLKIGEEWDKKSKFYQKNYFGFKNKIEQIKGRVAVADELHSTGVYVLNPE